MNILTIEKKRTELIDILQSVSSRRFKLKKINDFFNDVFSSNLPSVIESYILEFIPHYTNYLKSYSPFGINLQFTQEIIRVNEDLICIDEMAEYRDQLILLNFNLKDKLELLEQTLNGNNKKFLVENEVHFPVIEELNFLDFHETKQSQENISYDELSLGVLDSLTIKINKRKLSDKFIVIPSESERDKKLGDQILVSWAIAKEYCRKFIKNLSEFHEVIVSFNSNLGIYRGSSAGAALLIGMISELLKSYNSNIILEPIGGTAFTGGITKAGDLIPLSRNIIERKTNICFFSNCSILVVPKQDEIYAAAKLNELKSIYPKRRLEIVGVKNLDEILLRRDLVEIKKQSILFRGSKFLQKNWAGVVFSIILTVLLTYIFALDFDDNPVKITATSQQVIVKNKFGKILWVKDAVMPQEVTINDKILFNIARILDVDNDGKNEVLLAGSVLKNPNITASPGIMCFNNKGEMLWKYVFSDLVSCAREKLDSYYAINLILDTLTVFNHRSLFLSATNTNSFSSPIFRIDLRTGKRLPGALWCSGFVTEAAIKDLDADGKAEILAAGVDNGYEDAVIFTYTPDTLTSSRLSTKDYTIKDFPIANVKDYIRLPKTDFENYIGKRMPSVRTGTFYDKQNEKKYNFTVGGFYNENPYGYWAKLDYNLKDFDFVIDNEFRVYRDSLVAKGMLNLPYTDTEDYKQILKNKILYLKNGKWVKREKLD